MKRYIFIAIGMFFFGSLHAQTIGTSADVLQVNDLNYTSIQQTGTGDQSAWILQVNGDEESSNNIAQVKQLSKGRNKNLSFVYQLGSGNKSLQVQSGKGNEFNTIDGVSMDLESIATDEEFNAPNQDGDYHYFEQRASGDFNKANFYQAGRSHEGHQAIAGNRNEILTVQNGNSNTSSIRVLGDRNGKHYLQHGEGKFPHEEGEDESEHGDTGPSNGQGNGGANCQGDGGSPDVIPPDHDDDHEFVPTVGVAIRQMGKGSYALIDIDGDDNKAQITQRGGSCSNGNGGQLAEVYNHEATQKIDGSWNRVFADQRGTNHYAYLDVYGLHNLTTTMQKGNGSFSEVDINGNNNEIGTDQKGKGHQTEIFVKGNFNGNLLSMDEYGIKVTQEGKANTSEVRVVGDFNLANVYQNSADNFMKVSQKGNANISSISQESDQNTTYLFQNGDGNSATILQEVGNTNIINLTQDGGAEANILQSGDQNILKGIGVDSEMALSLNGSVLNLIQLGAENTLELNQKHGASATVFQTGMTNTSMVQQY